MIVSSLSNLLVQLGAEWVLVLMLVLSVISLAIGLLRFWNIRSQERTGAALWNHHVEKWFSEGHKGATKTEELILNYPCVESEVLALLSKNKVTDIEKGQLLVESYLTQSRMKLEVFLPFLGTIGNNAPFLGLLGTVIGIVKSFYQLGQGDAAAQGIQGMSGGISEALVSTAVGLFVAIPAVIANNYLRSRVDKIIQRGRSLGQMLLAQDSKGAN